MSKNQFEEIKMYRCKYCGKEFHTDSRHRCKFNPEYHNCFSCKHCIEIEDRTKKINTNQSIEDYFDPEISKRVVCQCGFYHTLLELSRKRWGLNCRSWECMDEYEGKITYLENVVWKLKNK